MADTNGRIAEREAEAAEMAALARKQHTRRILGAIDRGFTITGLRLSDPASGHEVGEVVTFDADEQAEMMAAIKSIVAARQ